ncbi:MAG: hypothetical protein CK425_10995 [Parachlamydia sp.]|nr:MAG: hypothetical protein CK425_10995 [Parachlamydia sp.]
MQNKAPPFKVLHLTFHKGCQNEVAALAKEFAFDLTTWFIPDLPDKEFDGKSHGCTLYNIGHERAKKIWKKHKTFFKSFDLIITSDTAPLARIFLQNKWKKPLIIWVCNRFDYADQNSLDCDFPDAEYYKLFARAQRKKNVRIIAYTEFEHAYAMSKGIYTGKLTITPGLTIAEPKASIIPSQVDKPETFYIPQYHNETIFMDLASHCSALGIPNYGGRYNGPDDLKDFKGIIHLPYAWSNLALFENLQQGIPYFVPSLDFFWELFHQNNYFHQDRHLANKDLIHLSEWYNPEHQPFLIYFNSWKDLQDKIEQTNYLEYRANIKAYALLHREKITEKWNKVLKSLIKS